jgi:hypothetical protein
VTAKPGARVVLDSITEDGDRLVTFDAWFHRFVLSEVNTHCVLSRNSASSRAIPLATQLERAQNTTAYPVVWASEQKGMSGGDEVEYPGSAQGAWNTARNSAIAMAKELGGMGVHKSLANRLLEPFMWHNAVITATALDNFFAQRCSPLAQPEIRALADAMRIAMSQSTPTLLKPGEWHTPYLMPDELDKPLVERLQVSTARCAGVSYMAQNNTREWDRDISIYERLTTADPMHASPLEHVATPCKGNRHAVYPWAYHPDTLDRADMADVMPLVLPKYGKLLGWHSHRYDVENARKYQSYA